MSTANWVERKKTKSQHLAEKGSASALILMIPMIVNAYLENGNRAELAGATSTISELQAGEIDELRLDVRELRQTLQEFQAHHWERLEGGVYSVDGPEEVFEPEIVAEPNSPVEDIAYEAAQNVAFDP